MKIAIDMDGVLTDLETFMKEEGAKFFHRSVKCPSGYDVDSIFGVSEKEKDDFWNSTFYEYILNEKFRLKTDEVTNRLAKEGNQLFIITARKWYPVYGFPTADDMTKANKESLIKQGIYFDEYIEAPDPKREVAVKEKIDVFIEDSPINALELSKVTNVFLMDAAYNRHIKGKNIYRVYNWNDVYAFITGGKI